LVEKKPRTRRKAEVVPTAEEARATDAEKVKEKIVKLQSLIDLIDEKIREKIEEDMLRVKITTNTAERELEGYSLIELRDMRKLYVSEIKGYEKQLAALQGNVQSRMIRPFFGK